MQAPDGSYIVAPTVLPPPPLFDGSEAPARTAEQHANLVKFQSELEFVQCLANPLYLYELHTQGYFADNAFLNYLEYLQYWHEPDYARFITYPTSLVYLTLLLRPTFREAIANPAYISELMRVGARHHETWRVDKSSASTHTSASAVKRDLGTLPSGSEDHPAPEDPVQGGVNGIGQQDEPEPGLGSGDVAQTAGVGDVKSEAQA